MPLIDFWSKHPRPDVHPEDVPHLRIEGQVTWATSAEAKANESQLTKAGTDLHRKLHTNLYPQPFVGNIQAASVYILFGNPGLSIQDYIDELDTPLYAAQCAANLSGQLTDFGPLLRDAEGTGAYRYWNSTFKRLIKETGDKLDIAPDEARTWVLSQVATIEAGAYHSRKFPVDGFERLPSTQAALSFVRDYVLNRAAEGKCVVFVWRQAKFWALGERSGTKERERRKANGRYPRDARSC